MLKLGTDLDKTPHNEAILFKKEKTSVRANIKINLPLDLGIYQYFQSPKEVSHLPAYYHTEIRKKPCQISLGIH